MVLVPRMLAEGDYVMFEIWRNMTPFGSDNVAASSVFANTRGLAIFNDMNGSIACTERFLRLSNIPCFYCASLPQIREKDYLDPDPEHFLAEYSEIIDACDPDFVVLLYGPVSSRVGLDIESFAQLLSARKHLDVLAVPTPMDQDYSYGIASSFEAIYKHLRPCMVSRRDAYNERALLTDAKRTNDPAHLGLLGLDLYDYAGLQNCLDMLPFFHCAWGCAPSLEDHARIAEVDKAVVMSLGALDMAKRMNDDLGIDYALLQDCDVALKAVPHLRDMRCRLSDALVEMFPKSVGTPWMREPSGPASLRILIVGDQVIAHAAATVIEELVAEYCDSVDQEVTCDFDYALPFGMDEDIAYDSDYSIEAEDELLEALTWPGYDIVIGPSGLSRFAFPNRFVVLENFAVQPD